MHCPECGTHIFRYFPKARWEEQYSKAWLRVENEEKANWLDLEDEDLKKIIEEYHNGDKDE
jgi:predicted  nucleic acid-binding Zn-ribbon protein